MNKTEFEIVPAPKDCDHPAEDPVWEKGDRVVTLRENRPATIRKVYKSYRNRANDKVKRHNYLVEFDSGVETVRFGYELRTPDNER